MAPSRSISCLTAILLVTLALPSNALYFYMSSFSPKCFFEDLPKDTLVVGEISSDEPKGNPPALIILYRLGHYEIQQWDPNSRSFVNYPNIGLTIRVEETFDNDHRVVNQQGSSKGRFTFSAADSGEHRMCFQPTGASQHQGYLNGGAEVGGVKVILDVAIGETSRIESADKDKISDIVKKVRDLNGRLNDIKREQVFMRVSSSVIWRLSRSTLANTTAHQEREAEFRDQSEMTNSRVVRWTLIQLAVLGVTCAWQLSHLRSFFIKQKLT